ncbi:MAG TPA: hypothetical protein VGP47_05450 [Parachlamydiaceae bacterium]|nr:hypothetical protein [Parachlamydiaceae bacterium]
MIRQAKDILSILDGKDEFTENETFLFQKLAIFDYLIGNLDRHEENWLVTFSSVNEITHIKAIDNANAFPKIQPEKGSPAARNQYLWKELKISDQKFSPEIINFVQDMITPDKLIKVVVDIKKECGDFLDEDMKNLLLLRQKVIYKLICEEDGKTPKDLADISTKEEMEAYGQPLKHG